MKACHKMLTAGLESLHLSLDEMQVEQLLSFIKLIEKWNKTFNLTAIRRAEDMVSLHLLDSLALVPFIQGKRIIDIGTGAGLPGIPLAICLPECEFTLLDSNAKKTRFVQQVILELGLNNVKVCHQRIEDYHPGYGYDTALTRAFASLSETVKLTQHVIANKGILLAMKGQKIEAELAEIPHKTVIPIQVPGLDAERCLVRIEFLEHTEAK
jgi:16S rRNA (guanine527-N7)-methyltransferase